MLTWEQRPVEIANLFNPAFCSVMLREAIKGYHDEKNTGLPYILSFLILPLVLHKPTRESFPTTTRTRMHVWLQARPETQIGFADRVRQLEGIRRETLIFGLRASLFTFDDDGKLILVARRFRTPIWPKDSEPAICNRRSHFVGHWFAQAGDTSTILTMWGIQP